MNRLLTLFLLASLMSCSNQTPEIKLGSLFSDHMVLQQKSHSPIWGTCDPGVIVSVEPSWGESVRIRSDKTGKWQVDIKTPEYGGPYTINVKARKSMLVIQDVLIGEVWLCSGQSNMEMPLEGWPPNDTINYSKEEINQANFPKLRMFTVEKALSFTPIDSCMGSWQICSPEAARGFSATGYFFGRQLLNELDVPIGLIHSSWGGTPAESWTNSKYLASVNGYEGIEEEMKDAKDQLTEFTRWLSKLEEIDMAEFSVGGPFIDFEMGDLKLASKDYDDSGWKTMELPNLWESQELGAFDGIVWFRKTFNYKEKVYPEGLKLHLGPIDDMDIAYINGEKIGGIEEGGFWTKNRVYDIPKGLLKEGVNTIAVRVIDTRGGGGIYGDENLAIKKQEQELVNLDGEWKYMPVGIFTGNKLFKFDEGETSIESAPKIKHRFDAHTPTVLYNAMISPIVPYTIKGVIWYQGESNTGRGKQYQSLFPQMIKNWRDAWQLGDFPFYYVQIAPYNYGETEPSAAAEVREAQLLTLKEKNVGMVVTTDIGNPDNIHPGNKQEVGRRLALLALVNDYGVEGLLASGPMFKTAKEEDNRVVVEFSSVGSGLDSKGEDLTYFELAGDNGVFYGAKAIIEDNLVIVTSDSVSNPKKIRFGWRDIAEPNLFNKEGLPASPFRADID